MKITLNSWLYNAGVVGFLRILRTKGIALDNQLEQGYFDLQREHLVDFHLAYFRHAAILYNPLDILYQVKGQNTKGDTKLETFKEFSKVENSLKTRLKEIKSSYHQQIKEIIASPSAENDKKIRNVVVKFFDSLEEEFKKVWDKESMKVVNKLFEAPKKSSYRRKIDEIREATIERIIDWYFVYVALQPFYKNKAVVGQAKVKPSRINRFQTDFVEPAIHVLDGKISSGITCKFCGCSSIDRELLRKEESDKYSFSENLFYPVGTTVNDFPNFFYNLQADMFFCDVCELILLCSWAGFNPIPFQMRSGEKAKDSDHVFVNLPSLELMLHENDKIQQLYSLATLDRKDTIYEQVLSDLFIQDRAHRAEWVLQNILFVEIRTVPRKDTDKPGFRYFHIGKDVAKLFTDSIAIKNMQFISGWAEVQTTSRAERLKGNNLYLKKEIVRRFLNSEPVYDLAFKLLIQIVKNRKVNSYNLFCLACIDSIRKQIWLAHSKSNHKGAKPMESKVVYGILKGVYSSGAAFVSKMDFEKRQRLSYRMLSLIRNGKYADFYDALMKLHIDAGMSIPEILLGILNTQDAIDFEAKAYAFMSGFLKDVAGTKTTEEVNEPELIDEEK